MKKELVESAPVHTIRVSRDGGFRCKHDLSCEGGVDGQHSPVHEATIAQVRVIDILRCPF